MIKATHFHSIQWKKWTLFLSFYTTQDIQQVDRLSSEFSLTFLQLKRRRGKGEQVEEEEEKEEDEEEEDEQEQESLCILIDLTGRLRSLFFQFVKSVKWIMCDKFQVKENEWKTQGLRENTRKLHLHTCKWISKK